MAPQNSDVAIPTVRANDQYTPQFPVVLHYNELSPSHSSIASRPAASRFLDVPDSLDLDRDHDYQVALQALTERLGCGYVVVDEYQRIVKIDAVAQGVLDQADASFADASLGHQDILRELLEQGGARNRLQTGCLIWLATSSRRGVSIVLNHIQNFTADRASIVVLLDLDTFPVPNPTTLKLLFGLTFAEARLAFHLAQGRTPNEIAKLLRVSRTTVRSQLAAIFSKTNTKRQSTLVALLSRIAVLP